MRTVIVRHGLYVAGGVVALGLCTSAQAALQAHWSFNEASGTTAADASGNANDATLANMDPNAAWVPGVSGNALQFDGTNDYVDRALNVNETDYSVALWFRTTTPTTGIYSVSAGQLGAGGHDRHLYLMNGEIGVRTWNSEILGTPTADATTYNDGQWHHLVHVLDSTAPDAGQRIYLDGNLLLSGVKAASDFNWQDHVHVGFSNDVGAGQYFTGAIDEVRVYTHALSQEEISALIPEPGAGLLLLGALGVLPLRRRCRRP